MEPWTSSGKPGLGREDDFFKEGMPEMLSREFKSLITPRARTLVVIWGAILLSPVMYFLIAWFIFGQGEGASAEVGSGLPLNQIGMGLLVVLGIGATYYQRLALGPARLRAILDTEPVAPEGNDRDLFLELPPSEQRLFGLWPHYQTTMIIVWAILEAIAVVGLVLTILQRDFMVMIPFSAAAILLLALKRPSPAGFCEGIRI